MSNFSQLRLQTQPVEPSGRSFGNLVGPMGKLLDSRYGLLKGVTLYQVKRSAPTMIKDEKGRWVKPDKETLKRMKEEWEAEQRGLQQREEESNERLTSHLVSPLALYKADSVLMYPCVVYP
eukprot:6564726-Pyramimonas_sp.AAC.1